MLTHYRDIMPVLSDEELSREVAVQTRLYRRGRPSKGRLDAVFEECQRRGKMEIFHAAQEREFDRDCTPNA